MEKSDRPAGAGEEEAASEVYPATASLCPKCHRKISPLAQPTTTRASSWCKLHLGVLRTRPRSRAHFLILWGQSELIYLIHTYM